MWRNTGLRVLRDVRAIPSHRCTTSGHFSKVAAHRQPIRSTESSRIDRGSTGRACQAQVGADLTETGRKLSL